MTRCAYCGQPVRRRIDITCTQHADLPNLDPAVQTLKFQRWWLERYTREQILVLAQSWTGP